MALSNDYTLHIPSLRDRVSEAEWECRLELAAALRVAEHLGWNEGIHSHISARVPGEPNAFLMNPLIGWHEVTASSLVKLDMAGNLLLESALPYARAGRNFHGSILNSKPGLACVIHVHALAGVTVSALEEGLRFYDQSATQIWGLVAYHDFEGMVHRKDEAATMLEELDGNFVMIMRNHGILSVGRTIGEAMTYMAALIHACQVQVALQSIPMRARAIPSEICEATHRQMSGSREGQPLGELDWAMYRRLADRRYPDYAS